MESVCSGRNLSGYISLGGGRGDNALSVFVFRLAHVFISVNIKSKNELDFFYHLFTEAPYMVHHDNLNNKL